MRVRLGDMHKTYLAGPLSLELDFVLLKPFYFSDYGVDFAQTEIHSNRLGDNTSLRFGS